MSVYTSGGSPVADPQRYHTLPTTILVQAEQQDRTLKQSEFKELLRFFQSGGKLLEIAITLSQNADEIVSTAANRIFVWGSPMGYLDPPPNRVNLPGYNTGFSQAAATAAKDAKQQTERTSYAEPSAGLPVDLVNNWLEWLKFIAVRDIDPAPDNFYRINILRYGTRNMRKSMRDIAWFLRYITYAIVAGDTSILTVNVWGLRGVIPENVTAATVVAIQTMKWKSLGYFKQDPEAQAIIRDAFDTLITEYQVEKPSMSVREGISNDQQGLQLPSAYLRSANSRPKFMIKPGMATTELLASIKAAYRQVFERDMTRAYGISLTDLESKVKGGEISVKEFIRGLGKSRLYRQEFYEPFNISRVVELAVRHFLGRGLSSLEEFQDYFDLISKGGLAALVDTLVDSEEYSDYFGEETVPYLRGLGQEAQECRNWGPQFDLFNFSASVRKVPQFVTLFGSYQQPLPNQHAYGAGNDPLETQFGAIFPDSNSSQQPAFFGKDHRRILIGSGTGNPHALGRVPGSLGSRVLKLSQNLNGHHAQGESMNLFRNSPEASILGAYRQVFGREVYDGQRLMAAEVKLKSGEIPMREFIRQLGKSRQFRKLFWESLYITKAIEIIHRRLLGRPTYARSEMARYYDLCAHQGFYALIDALLDSAEYNEVFGEDTVPYERYVTPRGLALRSPNGSVEAWHNGPPGSSRRPTEAIPAAAPIVNVSEGGNAWGWMMQQANRRSLVQSNQPASPKGEQYAHSVSTQPSETSDPTALVFVEPTATDLQPVQPPAPASGQVAAEMPGQTPNQPINY